MHLHASRFVTAPMLALALVLSSGCGSPARPLQGFPAGWPSDAERTLEPDHAPTAYTAAQIRTGCGTGRTIVFREVAGTEGPSFRWFKFTGGTAEQAEFAVAQSPSATEEPAKWTPIHAPWAGLQSHGSFPKAQTLIAFERVDTPIGMYDCALYTITNDKGSAPKVTRLWFAFDLPGPPVRHTVTEGGKVVSTTEIVRNTPPPR
jgi:hypothetical protein